MARANGPLVDIPHLGPGCRRPPSRWLIVAVVLGIICSIVGVADWINVRGSTQELFGQEVRLVGVGWGLWLTPIASIVFTVTAWGYSTERDQTAVLETRELSPEVAPQAGAPAAPAGWYPVPGEDPRQRYWDGNRWTEHLAPPVEERSGQTR